MHSSKRKSLQSTCTHAREEGLATPRKGMVRGDTCIHAYLALRGLEACTHVTRIPCRARAHMHDAARPPRENQHFQCRNEDLLPRSAGALDLPEENRHFQLRIEKLLARSANPLAPTRSISAKSIEELKLRRRTRNCILLIIYQGKINTSN